MNEMQQQAVSTRVPTVLVSAGAGSGKTRVLTQRYLDLLNKGLRNERNENEKVSVNQILTLTFTRKAAQEMRERIARELEAQGKVHERRELTRAPIGTIHSFCERVLREHALEAGIDPNFRLLDDAEARTLQEKVLDATFEGIWTGLRLQDEALGHLLLEYPHNDLRTALLDIYGKACTQGISISDITPSPEADMAGARVQLVTAVEDLLALPGTGKWSQAIEEAKNAYAELSTLLDFSQHEFTWDLYYRAQELQSTLTPAGGPKGAAKPARDAIKAAMACWLGACIDQCATPYLRAFLTLLRHFDQVYRAAKDEQGLLDFSDLLLISHALLDPAAEGGALTYFHKRFRQVMVDEFQDTNPLQYRIIRAFQGDGHLFMVGDVKQAIYRFIGSDVRVFLAQEQRITGLAREEGQRIAMADNYRSRSEVLGVLNAVFDRLWPADAINERGGFLFEPLNAGQEFTPKDIPSVELALMSADDDGVAELRDREAAWIARRILQLTGHLDEAPLAIKDEKADSLCTRPASFKDIILLFRASTDIPRYEDALRQAGVPFYVVSGRGFYQTREVQDIVHMLRVLDNPLDDFALAVVLRSPLVGVADDTLYWLSRDWSEWKPGESYPAYVRSEPQYGRCWENMARAAELPISEDDRCALARFQETVLALQAALPAGQPLDLIDMLLARTNYAVSLLASDGGDQRYANIQKLREVAADFQARGIFDLSDFQRYLTQLGTLAPREASAPIDVEASQVVRLMTIHAAKGLEAPIVFLADCGREPTNSFLRFQLTPAGLTCQVPTPEDDWASSATYAAAKQQVIAEEQREAERLLYVALTRAREHLICSGAVKFSGSPKTTHYAGLLCNLLELQAQGDDDIDLPLTYGDNSYQVRIWSQASLNATETLQPPPQTPTLWETHQQAILAGEALPVLTRAEEVEQFTRVVARLQQLPEKRREGPLRVGVNRAICFAKCPRQYWFRYQLHSDAGSVSNSMAPVSEMPADMEDDDRARMDGTAFGQLLHGVLQRVEFNDTLLTQAEDIVALVAGEQGVPAGAEDHAHLRACLQRLMAMPFYAELTRASVISRELRFLMLDGGIYVPGIIDVLACTDDRWWILDYKTGRPSADHQRQVAIYALGVQHALGVTPQRVCVAYLDSDNQRGFRDEPVTTELFDDARRLIREAGEGILRDDYHPQPGRHCEFCPHIAACPEGLTAELPVG